MLPKYVTPLANNGNGVIYRVGYWLGEMES